MRRSAGTDRPSPVDWRDAMAGALDEARRSGRAGDVPIGAVVVHQGQIISAAGNRRETDGDPTAHAEVLALRRAAEVLGTWRLEGCTLVVTLEPCPMCAGAAGAARTDRVVFGAVNTEVGAAGSLYNLGVDPRLPHNFEIVGGVMADECGQLLDQFFAARR